MFHAVFSVHDKERANKSPNRLLLLYSPPNQKVITNKKKMAVEYPNIQLAMRSVPCSEGLPIPECPECFYLDYDEENETVWGNPTTLQVDQISRSDPRCTADLEGAHRG
jgi:hypothetical protein